MENTRLLLWSEETSKKFFKKKQIAFQKQKKFFQKTFREFEKAIAFSRRKRQPQ